MPSLATVPQAKVPAGPVLTRTLPPALLWNMRYRPLEFLTQVGERLPIARLGWLGSPLYLVNDPQLLKEMLCDTTRFVKGTILRKLEVIIGKGLITLNGDDWRDARRRVQKLFNRGVLPEQHEIVIRHTRAAIERLTRRCSHGPVNLDRVMNELTFGIALELFVGAGPEIVDDMDELQWSIDTLNEYAKWRTWSVIPDHWNTSRNREFRRGLQILDDLVERVIRMRKAESDRRQRERCDVLSQMMQAGFEGKPLRDHIMTMLIAGHETTGTALAFLWAHVARRPDLQESLYQESASLSGEQIDLDALPMASAVWKEILRLYPSVPILDRLATEEVVLGGYRIPAGANVLWSPYVMHRCQRFWPDRSDLQTFHPEAFLTSRPPEPGVFVPFGEGPRMCLGKALADMEALTVVALFVRAFQLRAARPGPVRMRTLVTLRPAGGVPVQLVPRRVPQLSPQLARTN